MGERHDYHFRDLLQKVVDHFLFADWNNIICFRADILPAVLNLLVFLANVALFARD